MDRATTRTQWSLSTQSTYEDDGDLGVQTTIEEADRFPPASKEKENEATENKHTNNNNLPRGRSKANLKLLKRSHALKESTSPPPDVPLSPVTTPTLELPTPPSNNNNPASTNSNGLNLRPILKRDSSNQSTDSNLSSSLSRGNSMEHNNDQMSTQELEHFLTETINGPTKDKILLLKIESEIINLLNDKRKSCHKFGIMSSYQRMLVHKVAHYYNLDHNVDPSGQSVIVYKVKNARMPANKLINFFRGEVSMSEEPRKSILKRDSASFEDTPSFKNPDGQPDGPRRSKSFEEREEEYEKARARIFHQEHGDRDSCSQDGEDEMRWTQPPPTWERTASSDSTKLHPNSQRPSRLAKGESYECRDTLRANSLRSSVSKSYSFGGYDQTSNNRVLTKQDSGSSGGSGVSPSSSGYKSQRSDTTVSATPSPSATPHLATQLSNQSGAVSPDIEQDAVFWAVTSMASVPIGSVLINPQTGRPLKNDDGSVYHYHPDNPPKIVSSTEQASAAPPAPETGTTTNTGGSGQTTSVQSQQPTVAEEPSLANPPHPPASYHQVEEPHLVTGLDTTGATNVPLAPVYQHMPPPVPTSIMYNPPAESYPPPTNSGQPLIYSVPYNNVQYTTTPMTAPAPQLNTLEQEQLCNYLASMCHGEYNRTEPQHRQLVYCQPQYSQGATAAPTLPTVYFSPPNHVVPPTQPRHPATCSYQYPQQPDRSVSAAPECTYQPPGVHGYYARCPSAQPPSSGYFVPTATASMGLMYPPVHTQAARPYHRLPTPPNTTQNVCSPYPMNNYASVLYQPQMMAPAMMRPAMQLNMANSPPLRAIRPVNYNTTTTRSPVVRDPAPPEPPRHNNYATTMPQSSAVGPVIYRLNYPPGDYLLMNSRAFQSAPTANRLPPSVPTFTPLRRGRPRAAGPSPPPNPRSSLRDESTGCSDHSN
ncbi:R3H domain-containing protein 1 isoform X2 [Macrosteles quadrilineatus]|nr:R3H domain-containing protein 1 isoform X2 [Macrosteles quadrilineatus]